MVNLMRYRELAVVKYPTRKSFIEMQDRPKFQESHKHKDAGMEIVRPPIDLIAESIGN
jgi:hypothetical protein